MSIRHDSYDSLVYAYTNASGCVGHLVYMYANSGDCVGYLAYIYANSSPSILSFAYLVLTYPYYFFNNHILSISTSFAYIFLKFHSN